MIRRMLGRIIAISASALALSACVAPDSYRGYDDSYYDPQTDDWYVVASIDGRSCYPVAYDPFYDASYYALMGYGWSPVDCGPYYRYSPDCSRNFVSVYYGNHYGPLSPFWSGYWPGYYSGYNSGYYGGYNTGYYSGYYADPYWGYYPWGHHHHNKKKKKKRDPLLSADGRRERISPEVDYGETVRHRADGATRWPAPRLRPNVRVRSGRGWATGNGGEAGEAPVRAGTPTRVSTPAQVQSSDAPTPVDAPVVRRRMRGSEPVFRSPGMAPAPRKLTQPASQPRVVTQPRSRAVTQPQPVVTQPSAPKSSPPPTRSSPKSTSSPKTTSSPKSTSGSKTKSGSGNKFKRKHR